MKRQLMMSLTCTLAMCVNSVSAFTQGAPQERGRVTEGVSGNIVVEVAGTQVLPVDGFFNFVQGGGGRGGGGAAQTSWSFEGAEYTFSGKVVKGAPYSADAVTETVQTLSDGNRIVRHTASKIYRDGEGRERREQSLNAIGPWTASNDQPQTISITDPVSGVNYSLDPKRLIARKMTAQGAVAGRLSANTEEMKAQIERMATTRPASAEGAAKRQAEATITENRAGGARGGGGGGVATARPTEVAAVGARGGFGGGTPGGGTFGAGTRVEPKTESLGKQMISGVEAEGTRTTITIPVGSLGNELPINIVSERWYSPELQVVVMTKNSDPRTGENTYRLTNIIRSEPSPSLFQVPGDYKVEESFMRVSPTIATPIKKQESDK